MQQIKQITSKSNPLIKFYSQLQKKSSFRKKEKKFVIEGKREIIIALESGYIFDKILFNPHIINQQEIIEITKKYNSDAEIVSISNDVYLKIAYRDSTEGILAIANWKQHGLEKLKLTDNPLILVAEHIEKPGNIGAMLRTCDATAVDAFILASPLTDIYNPNIIRTSIGTVFSVQIGIAETYEVIRFLKNKKIPIYAATLQESKPFYNLDFNNPTAIVVGSEANGLTEAFRKNSQQNILIPMLGKIDSLNVSVSAAIFLAEAVRQRHYK